MTGAPRDRSAPTFYVKVSPRGRAGEQSERIDVTTKIRSFSFEDDEKKADMLSIAIDNFDLVEIDSGRWTEGQVIETSWGYAGSDGGSLGGVFSPVRKCVIKKTKTDSSRIKVDAHGESVLMDRETRSRTFDNMTRSEVVTKIAEENGYASDRRFVQDTGTKQATITQARMTDAQFLRHLANREGFEFFVDFDGLHWHERDLGQKPIRELRYFDDLTGEIQSWSVEGDLAKRASSVKTKGRDPITKTDINGEASNATETGRDTLGSFVITVDQRTGERTIDTSAANTTHDETQPTSETDQESAQREAAGRFKRSSANSFKLSLVIVGDPGMVAKSIVQVSGIGARLSGRYYVSKVKHSFGSGYTCTLECKRDAASSGGGIAGEGAEATGKQNQQKADGAADDGPTISVDSRTGSRVISYSSDSRGRSTKHQN